MPAQPARQPRGIIATCHSQVNSPPSVVLRRAKPVFIVKWRLRSAFCPLNRAAQKQRVQPNNSFALMYSAPTFFFFLGGGGHCLRNAPRLQPIAARGSALNARVCARVSVSVLFCPEGALKQIFALLSNQEVTLTNAAGIHSFIHSFIAEGDHYHPSLISGKRRK